MVNLDFIKVIPKLILVLLCMELEERGGSIALFLILNTIFEN
jgi:hypothetical protein